MPVVQQYCDFQSASFCVQVRALPFDRMRQPMPSSALLLSSLEAAMLLPRTVRL
eukprot:SAG31_NODE_30639_length_378_cov_0.845878_1_plen_53_part_10